MFRLTKKKSIRSITEKDGVYAAKSLHGDSAATAGNYGVFFIASRAVEVRNIRAIWTTASTSGTLNIERLSGTESLDAGDDILKATIDMSGTADTVNEKKGIDLHNTILKPGDRLALVDAGDLSNQNDLCITIYLIPVGKGHYE